MALDFLRFIPTAPADAADAGEFDVNQQWGENLVTAIATSLAVLVVATIAVLIGMA
jgi:hypothetical protein